MFGRNRFKGSIVAAIVLAVFLKKPNASESQP